MLWKNRNTNTTSCKNAVKMKVKLCSYNITTTITTTVVNSHGLHILQQSWCSQKNWKELGQSDQSKPLVTHLWEGYSQLCGTRHLGRRNWDVDSAPFPGRVGEMGQAVIAADEWLRSIGEGTSRERTVTRKGGVGPAFQSRQGSVRGTVWSSDYSTGERGRGGRWGTIKTWECWFYKWQQSQESRLGGITLNEWTLWWLLCILSRFSHVHLFSTPVDCSHQTSLSMGFSRQEYWSGLPCPPPGDLPNPGVETLSPALYADSLSTEPPGNLYGDVQAGKNDETLWLLP